VALPEQIRKQTEAVQELYKQLNSEEGGEAQADAGSSAESMQADESSDAQTAGPSVASEHKPADERVSEETILQKYRTLQGMYNAEVPRLHSQNKEMQQRVQQMEQLLASLSAQKSASEQPVVRETLVTQQDQEEYGESIDIMRKVSREELIPVAQRLGKIEQMLQQMQTSVVPQVQAVAKQQAVSAEQQFWSELTAYVPNWRDVNDNQDFQSWLLDIDPLTGIARQTYLDDAQRSLDAGRVANFFRTWLEMTGQAAVAQSTGRVSVSSELEKQVSPGRSRSAAAPQSSKSKTYTPEDIRKFFEDVRTGKYKGREPERDRIERDIFSAQRENRIQLNA
jgi:hypothetical protein